MFPKENSYNLTTIFQKIAIIELLTKICFKLINKNRQSKIDSFKNSKNIRFPMSYNPNIAMLALARTRSPEIAASQLGVSKKKLYSLCMYETGMAPADYQNMTGGVPENDPELPTRTTTRSGILRCRGFSNRSPTQRANRRGNFLSQGKA